MFYDVFLKLCNSVNKSPSAVALELGLNKSSVTNWKKRGGTPNDSNLLQIADYFGVSVDYLLGYETKKSPDQMSEDEEVARMVEELKNNPGMRILFSKTKNASKEDLEKVIKMLDIMRGE